MKKFMPFIILCAAVSPAMALTPAGQGRRATANQMVGGPRATASVNQINAMASMASMTVGTDASVNKPSIKVDKPEATLPSEEEKKDMREKEKAACINNNIGVGNTFVWAYRQRYPMYAQTSSHLRYAFPVRFHPPMSRM